MVRWHRRLVDMKLSNLQGDCGGQGELQSTGSQRGGRNLGTEQHTCTYVRHCGKVFNYIPTRYGLWRLTVGSRVWEKLQIHIPNPVLGERQERLVIYKVTEVGTPHGGSQKHPAFMLWCRYTLTCSLTISWQDLLTQGYYVYEQSSKPWSSDAAEVLPLHNS